ncbi:MAG: hypothetical protein LBS34_00340 [Rickettsiales bacterium]|jgi:hypothetical protein|nr:hypothetical protein [Rickettsiales bacterium]
MEEVFLKFKLSISDKSDLDREINKIGKVLENGVLKASKAFRSNMEKNNQFTEWGNKIAIGFALSAAIKNVFTRAAENVNVTQRSIDEEREKVADLRSYQRLLGTNEIQAQNLLAMLKVSEAKNPYNLLTNFVTRLSQARLGESEENYNPLLKKYKDMSNFDAFMNFLKDMSSGQIKSDDFANILSRTFGKSYTDNTAKMLSNMIGRGGVMESYNEQKKMIDKIAKAAGFSDGQELLSVGHRNIEESNRRELINKIKGDTLKFVEIIKPETLAADENLRNNNRRAELQSIRNFRYSASLKDFQNDVTVISNRIRDGGVILVDSIVHLGRSVKEAVNVFRKQTPNENIDSRISGGKNGH